MRKFLIQSFLIGVKTRHTLIVCRENREWFLDCEVPVPDPDVSITIIHQ